MNFRKFYEKYMSWMDKVRNLLDTSTSEKGCYVLSTEASYLISAPRIYHAERHGKVSLFLFVIQKCILFKYHHVQVTLPGGKRYTCYLHRLMKMLEANQYQMENLTVEEWSILPDYLKWIKLPDFDTTGLECSHLCWNVLCLRSDHIVIESHKVNILFYLFYVFNLNFQTNSERILCQQLQQ